MTHICGDDYLVWTLIDSHHLEKRFEFPDFASALKFVNEAGEICENVNHHAQFILNWGFVIVKTWSHDVNSVTERDHKLSKLIDELIS
jgi:4a-hydroxytetrahydrobiopterin dehydratase